ncbi:shikimate dehydrogenase [Microlunatus panaciterrae]
MLGSPIEHSLSPALHLAAYEELGLSDWSYERHEMDEVGLPDFVRGRDASWRGLSLTMPLKVVALGLGEVDPVAGLVGAANTLIFDDDGRRVFNTDVGGLVSAVRGGLGAGRGDLATVVVLGTGATARSTLASAAELGAGRVIVVARTPSRAEALRPLALALGLRLDVQPWGSPLPAADLLVSTVTAGAADAVAADAVAAAPIIFDVVYDPWPTALASAAEHLGVAVLNGLDLLVGQAVLQVRLMTGRDIDPAVLMSAGRAELSRRAGA